MFYGAPSWAEQISKRLRWGSKVSFESKFGNTKGFFGPSEYGAWWYRFFQRAPAYVHPEDICNKKMLAFRRSVAKMINASRKPVLFKNLYAALRLRAIAEYLPESLFVVIHRDEVEIGHSLLEARYETYGSYAPWWTVEPPRFDELQLLPPEEQVIEQVRQIYDVINKDLEKGSVPSNRRIDICYDEFCADPGKVIKDLEHFFQSHDVNIETRNDVVLPNSFNKRANVKIDNALYNRMVGYANSTKPDAMRASG